VLLAAACLVGCKMHGTELPAIGDGHPAAACPAYLDLELIGADSRFDPGWTGSSHGVGLPNGSQLSVKVDQCDAECRRCTFHGPVRADASVTPVVSQRCLKDVSKICAADLDCGAAAPCRFVFPPIASKVPLNTCSLAYFEPLMGGAPPVQGVMDLATGESDLKVLNLQIALALESCVTCQNDPMPFDGVAGGTCAATTRACDVHGISTSGTGSTSYDCPPSLTSATTIVLGTNGTSTSSVQWTMDATRPMCTATGSTGKSCWCGMCTDGKPCTSTKDCTTGTCGAAKGPAPTNIPWNVANNQCTNGTCNWNPATQSGRCTDDTTRPCYPDTGSMIATGLAEVHDGFYISQLANLICMPSFSTGGGLSALVDIIGGFPGPFLFQSRFRVTTRQGP
jgi:hypothetical protein